MLKLKPKYIDFRGGNNDVCLNMRIKLSFVFHLFMQISLSIQVRPDWESTKIDVMYRALKCKFATYPHLQTVLLSTAGSVLVEASPHDLFWGGGRDGEGLNYLGRLLMQLRSEILEEASKVSVAESA